MARATSPRDVIESAIKFTVLHSVLFLVSTPPFLVLYEAVTYFTFVFFFFLHDSLLA